MKSPLNYSPLKPCRRSKSARNPVLVASSEIAFFPQLNAEKDGEVVDEAVMGSEAVLMPISRTFRSRGKREK